MSFSVCYRSISLANASEIQAQGLRRSRRRRNAVPNLLQALTPEQQVSLVEHLLHNLKGLNTKRNVDNFSSKIAPTNVIRGAA